MINIERFTTEKEPSPEASGERPIKSMDDFEAAYELLDEVCKKVDTLEFDPREIDERIDDLRELFVFMRRDIEGHEIEILNVTNKYHEVFDVMRDAGKRIGEIVEDTYPDLSFKDYQAKVKERTLDREKVMALNSRANSCAINCFISLSKQQIDLDHVDANEARNVLKELAKFGRVGKDTYGSAEVFNSVMNLNGARFQATVDKNGDPVDRKEFESVQDSLEEINRDWPGLIQREVDIKVDFLTQTKSAREKILKNYAEYGLDGEEILEAESSRIDRGPDVSGSIDSIERLEEESPGAAKLLQEKFGIRNFARYPTELLVRQAEQAENKETRYGILINPAGDASGAFTTHRDVWHKMMKQLNEHGYEIRVIEGDKIEIARKLIELNKEYGDNHRISFSIIGGHGDKDSIQFGGTPEKPSELTISEIFGNRRVQQAMEFFEENPIFILVSCATGADGGIGEELSGLNARVVAPRYDTGLEDIEVTEENGVLQFDVQFEEREGKGPAVATFSGGYKERD